MASNLPPKFASSAYRPPAPNSRGTSPSGDGMPHAGGLGSVSLGEIERQTRLDRNKRAQKRYARYIRRVGIVLACLAVLVGAGVALYFSPAFTIEEVSVQGADHLTSQDMAALTAIEPGATLLNVDTGAIEQSVLRDAWVEQVQVHRSFPSTLLIEVTERTIAAVVEVPTDNAKEMQNWAIASDGMWLMAIPAQDSELGQALNPQIYADAESVLTITNVPYGLVPEIGTFCTDENVNNALRIIEGLSPAFAAEVKTVSATDAASTLLVLNNGVEIAFGEADHIEEKEQICQKIMEDNEGKVAYINVRVVERPTWRAV